MSATLLYQGHSSFRLVTPAGLTVYIDPFAGEGYDLPADLILSTHGHGDHTCFDLVPKKSNCRTIPHTELISDGHYLQTTVGDLEIRAVPAYNQNHDRRECVGLVLAVAGKGLYLAGDTSQIPEMAELKALALDYAFLPCDGVYNMDVAEAEACAGVIGAKHTVPIHTCKDTDGIFDQENAARFQAEGRLILEPGTTLAL